MTAVSVYLTQPDAVTDVDVPVEGSIECVPTRRRHIDTAGADRIVLPVSVKVKLEAGRAVLLLDPTGPDWCWRIREHVAGGIIWYVLIPDVETIDYGDLVEVDIATLDPVTPVVPAYKALIDAAQTAADDATAAVADKVDADATGRERLAIADYDKLLPWYAALANRANARVNVGILGASLVEGAFVSTLTRTVAQNLATILRARHPTPGLATGGRGYIGVPSGALTTSSQYTPGMWPFAFTGGLLDPIDPGPSAFDVGAKHMTWYTNAAGAKVVLTLAGSVTSFDIHHVVGPSGGATTGYYKIDGGAPTPFATYGAAPAKASVLHVTKPATTSIEVGWNGAGYLIFSGITEYAGDESKGIQVHNLGHSGFTIAEWQDGYGTAGGWREAIAALDLDLLILQDLGANDGGAGITPAQFQTQLASFITILRAGGIACPLVLAPIQDPSGGIPLAAPWTEYVAAHKTVADADPTAILVDHSVRLPSTVGPDTLGLWSTIDHVHPRSAGTANLWIAETYARALAPA